MIDDPIDLLRAHVRRQADAMHSSTAVDELIAHITLEHDRRPTDASAVSSFGSAARPPRRWGSAAVAVALCIGMGTGAIVTAAVLDRTPVPRPELGVFCGASPADDRLGLQVVAGDDPIATCAALWISGELTLDEGPLPERTAPPLIACIGRRESLEVLPAEHGESCASLGLTDADVSSMAASSRAALNERVREINSLCLSLEDTRKAAAAVLEDLGLQEWHVELVDGAAQATGDRCGLIAFGSGSDQTLHVNTRSRS